MLDLKTLIGDLTKETNKRIMSEFFESENSNLKINEKISLERVDQADYLKVIVDNVPQRILISHLVAEQIIRLKTDSENLKILVSLIDEFKVNQKDKADSIGYDSFYKTLGVE